MSWQGNDGAMPEAIEIEVGDRDRADHQPGPRVLPSDAARPSSTSSTTTSASAMGSSTRCVSGRACCTASPGPGGREGPPEAASACAPPWVETVRVHFPRYHRDRRRAVRHRAGERHLGGADVHRRVPPVELPAGRRREARTNGASTSTRCRLCDFATVRRVAHVAHEVLDELGATGWPKTSGGQRPAHLCPHRRGPRLRRRAPGRARLRARGRAARARGRHDHLVAQGPRPRRPVRRLQPERPRPHHRRGVLACAAPPRAPCRPRSRWDEVDDVAPDDFTLATVPQRFAAKGDLHAGIDDAVYSIEPLLEWADRDERDGAETPPEPTPQD